MKTHIKIGGIFLFLLLSFVGILGFSGIARAAGGPINGSGEWRQATFTMNEKSKVIVNLAGNDHDNIVFTDSAPNDPIHNYVADTNNTGVCDGNIKFNTGQTFNNHPVKASISVNFENSASGLPTCTAGTHNGANDSYSNSSITIINNTTNGGNTAADTGPTKITYNGQDYLQLNTTSGKTVYGVSKDVNSCYGKALIVLDQVDSAANAPVQATLTGATLGTAGDDFFKHLDHWPSGVPVYVAGLGKCSYKAFSAGQPDPILQVDKSGAASCIKNCPAPSNNDVSSADCVANGGTGLEWLLCPITSSLSSAADGFNSIVEDQLNFNVDQNLSNTNAPHTAWSVIKDVTSVVLVILLLVMVIAQAVGSGPFEAYTIKKMLPKLVIAIIAMQISWDLCKFLISLANDAGHGIADLLTLPMGGTGFTDLNSILHRLNPAWAFAAQPLTVLLLAGGVIIGFMALPGVFVMAFSLFIGIFAAFMTLLFRNVLIEALVIFSPLFFLAWTMQGTQNYWKLWKDNFTKLLLMFPLVMAIIYVGRMFAWIAAGNGSAGFIDYMTVLIAYFGPYFIIFKAYKWGGSLMSAAGNGIAAGRSGLTKANEGWLKTLGQRAQGNLSTRYDQAREKERQAFEDVASMNDRIAKMQEYIEKQKAAGRNPVAAERRLATMQKDKDRLTADALEAQKRNGRFRRAGLRIAAGKPIPSQRNQLEMLAQGAQYKKELVEQKQALIHDDYVSQLNATGSVKDAKKYIRDKYGYGNMVKDASGNETAVAKDAFTERAFWNWAVDTKSAMELGDTNWRTDNGSKIDLVKTKGFMGMMNADPQRYAYVASLLPEFQPFNQEGGGGPKKEEFMVGGKRFAQLEKEDAAAATIIRAGAAPGATAAEQKAATEMLQLKADDARYAKIFQNMEHSSDMATWRPEQLQMMAENIKRLKRAGASTSQAEAEIREVLTGLKESPTPEAKSTLQRLLGGKMSAVGAVNDIMGDRWLQDSLNVPITVEGAKRETALPRTPDGHVDKKKFIEEVTVVGLDGKPTKSSFETARTLAEGDAYAKGAHGIDRVEIETNYDEAVQQAANSRNIDTIDHMNQTTDLAIRMVDERAQRLINEAIQEQSLTPAQLQLTEERITHAAQNRIAELKAKKIPRPIPGDDPTTVLKITHGARPANPLDEWFKNASDYDIANLAARVGGYNGLADDDLQRIYNYRSGTLKTEAENVLRTKGLIP